MSNVKLWTIGSYVTLQLVGSDEKVGGFMLLNPAGRDHVFVPSKWRPGDQGKPDSVVAILDQLNKK